MLPESETEITELTAVLKALAEPNRMRIFAELMQG
jgi:DNA-binding transcriptional ArsR family regulator